MSAFNDWKKRLEEAASKFDDPEAREQAKYEQGQENYKLWMDTIHGFLVELEEDDVLPEKKKVELAVRLLRDVVGGLTNGCKLFARLYPDEADAIITWHEDHIRMFQTMIAELEEIQ